MIIEFRQRIISTSRNTSESVKLQLVLEDVSGNIFRPQTAVVVNYGVLNYSMSLDELFIPPASLDVTIIDPDNEVWSRIEYYTTLRIGAKLFVNNNIKFVGRAVPTTIEFNAENKELKMTLMPSTNNLNSLLLYNEDGTAISPLGYSRNAFVPLRVLLRDIVSLADSQSVGVDFRLDHLVLKAREVTGGVQWITNGNLSECLINTNPLFYDNAMGMRTVGDVLRQISKDLAMYVVIGVQPRAVVRPLFVIYPEEAESYNLFYKGCYVKESAFKHVHYKVVLPQRFLSYKFGTPSGIDYENLTMQALAYFWHSTNPQGYSEGGTTVYLSRRVNNIDVIYAVWGARLYWENVFNDAGSIIGRHWFNNRRFPRMTYKFEAIGVDYYPHKPFLYNGEWFQVVDMQIDLDNAITRIEAIRVPPLDWGIIYPSNEPPSIYEPPELPQTSEAGHYNPTTKMVSGEVVNPPVHYTAKPYVKKSTKVFVNGLRLRLGIDYKESEDADSVEILFYEAGDIILMDYESQV